MTDNPYALSGPHAPEAVPVKWYRPKVDPSAIRALMQKSDKIALRDTVIWLGLMAVSGTAAALFFPSWWSLPFWPIMACFTGQHQTHAGMNVSQDCFQNRMDECSRLPDCQFYVGPQPVVWRASHVRHHTDTIVVGRDPEIVAMRPPDLLRVALNLFGIIDTLTLLRRMALHVTGRLHQGERSSAQRGSKESVFHRCIWLVIYLATAFSALAMGSIVPSYSSDYPDFTELGIMF